MIAKKCPVTGSALVIISGTANATIWNIEMNSDAFLLAPNGPVQTIDFIDS